MRAMSRVISLVMMMLSLTASAWATTWTVNPGDNLAQIIWDSQDGDTILVNEGTYLAQATLYTPPWPPTKVKPSISAPSGLVL